MVSLPKDFEDLLRTRLELLWQDDAPEGEEHRPAITQLYSLAIEELTDDQKELALQLTSSLCRLHFRGA